MKIKHTKSTNLPAITLSLDALEILIPRLTSEFKNEETTPSLSIKHAGKEYSFESVTEIRECVELPNEITNMHIDISNWLEGQRTCFSLHASDGIIGSGATISAESENEVWSAGILETARSFLAQHQSWHSRFRGFPLNMIYVFSFLLCSVGQFAITLPKKQQIYFSVFSITFMFIASIMFFWKGKFFPGFTLQIREPESKLRANAPIIALAISGLGLILNVVFFLLKQ